VGGGRLRQRGRHRRRGLDDKVDAEVPAPASGTITKLVAAVDDEVAVGQPLAEMESGEAG